MPGGEMTAVKARYDAVAEAYDNWLGPPGAPLDDPTVVELTGDVAGLRVCSVACGSGREARQLAGRGARVVGVDVSDQLLRRARSYEATEPRGVSYLRTDAQTLAPLRDTAFDGVLCHMALMDIPSLDATVAAVARVLRPGGWFVFSITHPCFKAPATGELVDHVDGSIRRTVGRYFVEGYWDGPGRHSEALPVGAYHRTLSTYVNTLAAAGLVIEQLREPVGTTPVWREVPCILYARCRRT